MNPIAGRGWLSFMVLVASGTQPAFAAPKVAATPAPTQAETTEVTDAFAGTLSKGWVWLDEEHDSWRTSEGRLNMKRFPGKGFWGVNSKLPVLYRPAVPFRKGMEIEVTVGFDVDRPYGEAGIVVFYDNDRYAKFTLEYWYNLGTHVHFLREDNGVPCRCEHTCERTIKLGKTAVELKLTYDGEQFITAYRLVGETEWTPHFKVDALKNEGPVNVGLFSQADWGSQDWAWFDGFRLRSSTRAP